MMNKLEQGKAHAITQAKAQLVLRPSDRAHLGSFIARRKQHAFAMNRMSKTHPDFFVWVGGEQVAKGVHAEQLALIRGRKFTDGAVLFVARVQKSGGLVNARPCLVCRELIREAQVKKVHYSIGPNEWGAWSL
jgi:deoxycytidylate deaminase